MGQRASFRPSGRLSLVSEYFRTETGGKVSRMCMVCRGLAMPPNEPTLACDNFFVFIGEW
jgi:hypothetical protein